jgi:parvulin-like peptidyl-prolyl isomerase
LKRVAASGLASLIALTTLAGLAGCGGNAKKVAIRVNKDTVTDEEFYKRVQDVSLADLAPASRGLGPAKAGEYAVEHIIIELLLKQLGEQKGVKPTDAEVNAYAAVSKKYQANPTLSILPNNPFRTDEDLKREARLALIQRGLALGPLKITPDEIQKRYEQMKPQITPEDQYHLRVIQVSSADKANKVLDTLKKGVAFETVALTQSEEPNSKAKSGDIGNVPQGALPPQLLAAIKDLKPGEYTKTPIKMGGVTTPGQPAAPSQFLIAQVVEKIPGVPPTLDEAKYVVERVLMQEKDPNFAQRVQQDLAGLRKSADIQVNIDGYSKLVDQIKNTPAPPAGAMPATGAPGVPTR